MIMMERYENIGMIYPQQNWQLTDMVGKWCIVYTQSCDSYIYVVKLWFK